MTLAETRSDTEVRFFRMSLLLPPSRSVDRPFTHAHWPQRDELRSPFRIDRRETARWSVLGSASLLTLGHDLGRLIELHDLDGAAWWLAGVSDAPIAVGSRVSVGFSDPSARSSSATVMRCDAIRHERFRIAVQFDGAALV